MAVTMPTKTELLREPLAPAGELVHKHDCPATDEPRIERYTVRDADEQPVPIVRCLDCVAHNIDAPAPNPAA